MIVNYGKIFHIFIQFSCCFVFQHKIIFYKKEKNSSSLLWYFNSCDYKINSNHRRLFHHNHKLLIIILKMVSMNIYLYQPSNLGMLGIGRIILLSTIPCQRILHRIHSLQKIYLTYIVPPCCLKFVSKIYYEGRYVFDIDFWKIILISLLGCN